MQDKLILYIAIGLGGFIGAILRYLASEVLEGYNIRFPLGTFVVNVVGCFLIGFFDMVLSGGDRGWINNNRETYRLFISVGLLGSFTTFSTFTLESYNLFYKGEYSLLFLNVILSLLFGYVGLLFGRGIYLILF